MGSTSLLIVLYFVMALIYWLISKIGDNCLSKFAEEKLASYTISNVYAGLYSTRLPILFMTVLNVKYIVNIGF